jgi:predicted  nucleic acid-binding Zn-ribbon protein
MIIVNCLKCGEDFETIDKKVNRVCKVCQRKNKRMHGGGSNKRNIRGKSQLRERNN